MCRMLAMASKLSHLSSPPAAATQRSTTHTSKRKIAFRVLLVCVFGIGVMFVVFSAQTFGRTTKALLAQSGGAKRKAADSSFTDGEYASETEQLARCSRFPSTEDRVKFYMGAWYTPACTQQDRVQYAFFNETFLLVREALGQADNMKATTFVVKQKIQMARVIYLNLQELEACDNGYCDDVKSSMVPTLDKVASSAPILLQFGDSMETVAAAYRALSDSPRRPKPRVPVFKKCRQSIAGGMEGIIRLTNHRCSTGGQRLLYREYSQPIIWRLNSKRHYGTVSKVSPVDIPWKDKKDVAVFRGGLTGRSKLDTKTSDTNNETMNGYNVCMRLQRCQLVYNTANSPLVDARITNTFQGIVPDVLAGVSLVGDILDLKRMLEYKAIIMLEGNDVSTGLKWALYSHSVLMATPPEKASWAMEDLLEPWVHYIPLSKDLTDTNDKMQWVIDNDEAAQKIARRGSLWMKDMLYHPDSKTDDDVIFNEIVRRYRSHFIESDEQYLRGS